jgi:hypothetical protein
MVKVCLSPTIRIHSCKKWFGRFSFLYSSQIAEVKNLLFPFLLSFIFFPKEYPLTINQQLLKHQEFSFYVITEALCYCVIDALFCSDN